MKETDLGSVLGKVRARFAEGGVGWLATTLEAGHCATMCLLNAAGLIPQNPQ